MSDNKVDILTPVGRLVEGSVFESTNRGMGGEKLYDKDGKPAYYYYFAVAFEKTDKKIDEILNKIQDVARSAFPRLFDAKGNCKDDKFAWKIKDGDKYPEKQGFAGCWIIKFRTIFAPKIFAKGGGKILTDKEAIKRGYYIRVYATVYGNAPAKTAGLYINPLAVEFVGYGEEIVSTATAASVEYEGSFGSSPVAHLPAGVKETPSAPTESIDIQGVQPHPGFLNVSRN